MSETTVDPRRPRGYARLGPETRSALADAAVGAGVAAALISLFQTPSVSGLHLRLPLLLTTLLLLGAAWYIFRRRGLSVSPILRGGLFVALAASALLLMTFHKVGALTSLAGLLAAVAAFALRAILPPEQTLARHVHRPAEESRFDLKVFEQVEAFMGALILVLLVWHFGLEAFRIPSPSMLPTLYGDPWMGDRVLVDKVAYEFRDPRRWEPVVFRYPLRRSDPYVKRCVGLPGEQILIAGGDIYLREHEGAEVRLLTKSGQVREVLWYRLVGNLDENRQFIKHFRRFNEVEFKEGVIRLGKGSRAVFPKGRRGQPGNVVDHDPSGGLSLRPGQFGGHVVGDLRIRARVTLDEDGELTLTIVRDDDRYILTLRAGAGGCRLKHARGEDQEKLAAAALNSIELGDREDFELEFSLADGELLLAIDGRRFARVAVGSPLLEELRAQPGLNLSSPEAITRAGTEPANGRQGRIIMAAGRQAGVQVRILGIDRDIYYTGRPLENDNGIGELPFAVELAEEQYFVLGDNSPESKDARAWYRLIFRMKDGSRVAGDLDSPTQELTRILDRIKSDDGSTALRSLQRVAAFTHAERGADTPSDDEIIRRVYADLIDALRKRGKGALQFETEIGGVVQIDPDQIAGIGLERVPYVERKLFVGRPFAVFLMPQRMKLID